jgi:tyrosyl-tRNA synthetase
VVTNSEIYPSKGEARRAIQGNGLSINKVKIPDPNALSNFDLMNDKYLLVSKGKKHHLLRVV